MQVRNRTGRWFAGVAAVTSVEALSRVAADGNCAGLTWGDLDPDFAPLPGVDADSNSWCVSGLSQI